MTSHSRAIDDRTRNVFANRTASVHRALTFPAAAVAFALLFGACNRSTPTEVQSSQPGMSSDAHTPMSASSYVATQRGDVAGVTAVVTAWDAAWNAGNANALAATFTEDAEFINGRGQLALGAATIRANHTASLAGVFKGSHTQGTIRKITFLSDNAAVVDVDNDVTNFTALPPGTVPTRPGVQSGRHKRIVVKLGSTWRVKEMQLTSILPAAPPVP
ncbi:MAG: SgcJ/EcaC family oxidoreductase [bacterium]